MDSCNFFKSIIVIILGLVLIYEVLIGLPNSKKALLKKFNNGETMICSYWFKNYTVNKKYFEYNNGYVTNGKVTFELDECLDGK